MGLILEGIKKAFWLLVTGDPEVLRITFLSLQVSRGVVYTQAFQGGIVP